MIPAEYLQRRAVAIARVSKSGKRCCRACAAEYSREHRRRMS